MNNTLAAYNIEIQPMIRELLEQKELLKEFKEGDAVAIEMAETVKEAQEALKMYIEKSDAGSEILESIKALENDIKLAIKGAAKGTDFKPADLKGYMFARAKEKVQDAVDKGELYQELDNALGE